MSTANDFQNCYSGHLDSSRCDGGDVIGVTKLRSLDQFQELMAKARQCRRLIVKCILEKKEYPQNLVLSLENIERTLEEKLQGVEDGVTLTLEGVELDVHDEMQMLKKDCQFLSFYKTDGNVDLDGFIDFLSQSHPAGRQAFIDEMNALLKMFTIDLSDRIDVFITDWDGTMKTYASTYQTSIQPLYSGVILSLFVQSYAKVSAVLTAGPLCNFGILDSTTVPWEDDYLAFGGSWGREWMIEGRRVAEENVLTPEGADALKTLGDSIERLLEKDEYSKFVVVGSGCQRKMDRITVGIQNVTGKVNAAQSQRYIDAVLEEVKRIDPNGCLFEVVRLELELEVALKSNEAERTWTKADGIRFFMENVRVNPANGNVLICGDTVSDVPMVETMRRVNPNGTFAVFVNPNEHVKNAISSLLLPNKRCFVGCPEVLHAAMAKQVLRS